MSRPKTHEGEYINPKTGRYRRIMCGPKQKKELYARIASKAKYLNKEIVEEVCTELVKVIVSDLRKNKFAVIPDLVRLRLVKQRRKQYSSYGFGTLRYNRGEETENYKISVNVDYKLRKFFGQLLKSEKLLSGLTTKDP